MNNAWSLITPAAWGVSPGKITLLHNLHPFIHRDKTFFLSWRRWSMAFLGRWHTNISVSAIHQTFGSPWTSRWFDFSFARWRLNPELFTPPVEPFIGLRWFSLSLSTVLFQLIQLLPTPARSVMYVQLYQSGWSRSASRPLFLWPSPDDAGYCRAHNGLTRPPAGHRSICPRPKTTVTLKVLPGVCCVYASAYVVTLFDEKGKWWSSSTACEGAKGCWPFHIALF